MLFEIRSGQFVDTEKVNYARIWDVLKLDPTDRKSADKVMKLYNGSHPDLAGNDHLKTRRELESAATIVLGVEITLSSPSRPGVPDSEKVTTRSGKFLVDRLIDEELLIRKERVIEGRNQPVYELNLGKLYSLENGIF